METPSDDDLNVLYKAALEFGKNWMRPVRDLAVERLPSRPPEYYDAVSEAVQECRAAINLHVATEHGRLHGKWRRSDARLVDSWIAEKYPWMTGGNRRRALSQGQYYAHHNGW